MKGDGSIVCDGACDSDGDDTSSTGSSGDSAPSSPPPAYTDQDPAGMPGPPSFEEVADPEVEDTETTEATTTDEVDNIEVGFISEWVASSLPTRHHQGSVDQDADEVDGAATELVGILRHRGVIISDDEAGTIYNRIDDALKVGEEVAELTAETTEASTEGTEPEPEVSADDVTKMTTSGVAKALSTIYVEAFKEETNTALDSIRAGSSVMEASEAILGREKTAQVEELLEQIVVPDDDAYEKLELITHKGGCRELVCRVPTPASLCDCSRCCLARTDTTETATATEAPASKEKAFYIHVTTLAGVKFKFLMRPSDTVLAVKEKITKRARKAKGPTVPPHDQRLHFAVGGKMTELENDETLGHYNIKSGSTLSLVLCLRGGSDTASGGMPHREAAAAAATVSGKEPDREEEDAITPGAGTAADEPTVAELYFFVQMLGGFEPGLVRVVKLFCRRQGSALEGFSGFVAENIQDYFDTIPPLPVMPALRPGGDWEGLPIAFLIHSAFLADTPFSREEAPLDGCSARDARQQAVGKEVDPVVDHYRYADRWVLSPDDDPEDQPCYVCGIVDESNEICDVCERPICLDYHTIPIEDGVETWDYRVCVMCAAAQPEPEPENGEEEEDDEMGECDDCGVAILGDEGHNTSFGPADFFQCDDCYFQGLLELGASHPDWGVYNDEEEIV